MDLDGRLEVGREGTDNGVEDAVVAERLGRKEADACTDETSETDVGEARKRSVTSADAQAR